MLGKGENNLRIFSFVTGIIFITFLFGCTSTTKEMEIVDVTPNKDVLAQFAFEDRVYFLEGNETPAEKNKYRGRGDREKCRRY